MTSPNLVAVRLFHDRNLSNEILIDLIFRRIMVQRWPSLWQLHRKQMQWWLAKNKLSQEMQDMWQRLVNGAYTHDVTAAMLVFIGNLNGTPTELIF